MRTAYVNPSSGVSGDMILGALVDCGVSRAALLEELGRLLFHGWSFSCQQVMRGGIRGTRVQISIPRENRHRHLSDIEKIIGESDFNPRVREKSLSAFRLLAEAEAFAHGVEVSEVHFHEVGAMDAILDIVGAFAGLELLGVARVCSGPVALGSGSVECAHGTMPVPVPAVVRLMNGVPVVRTTVPFELTTPTGAAILRAAVDDWECTPLMVGEVSGMGAGSRDIPGRSNLLGLVIGSDAGGSDQCLVLETLVDDMDARLWPGLSSRLLAAGAVDCWCVACLGRKGRPALSIQIILPPAKRNDVLDQLFLHSTTLGVRETLQSRVVLGREFRAVETPWGPVRVKLGLWKGKVVNAMPEFSECLALAESAGVPVKVVLDRARGIASELFNG